jgi:hypothetical protein
LSGGQGGNLIGVRVAPLLPTLVGQLPLNPFRVIWRCVERLLASQATLAPIALVLVISE